MLKALVYYNYHLKYITICETLFVAFSSYFSTLGTSKDRDGRTSPDFCNPVSTLTPHLLCWSDHKLGLFILHIPDSHFSPDPQGLNVDFLHISQCFVKYFLYLKTQNELAPHPSMAIEKWEGYLNFRGHSWGARGPSHTPISAAWCTRARNRSPSNIWLWKPTGMPSVLVR